MLIETIRREPNTPIPMPIRDENGEVVKWATYYFIPADESDTDSPHVADVTQKDHVKRFLSLDMYAMYEGSIPKNLVRPVIGMKPGSANAAGHCKPHPAAVPYVPEPQTLVRSTTRSPPSVEAPVNPDRPLADVVFELRECGAASLRKAVDTDRYTRYQVEAAVTEERARTDAPPRNTWLQVCENYLKTLDEAKPA